MCKQETSRHACYLLVQHSLPSQTTASHLSRAHQFFLGSTKGAKPQPHTEPKPVWGDMTVHAPLVLRVANRPGTNNRTKSETSTAIDYQKQRALQALRCASGHSTPAKNTQSCIQEQVGIAELKASRVIPPKMNQIGGLCGQYLQHTHALQSLARPKSGAALGIRVATEQSTQRAT